MSIGAESIAPERAYELLQKNWTYLDVRTVAEFATGHVPGAKNIWFGEWRGPDLIKNPRFLEIVRASFPMGCHLIVSCQTGKERATQATEQLTSAGFFNVLRMRGGFDAERDIAGNVVFAGWRMRELPVAYEGPTENEYEFLAARAAVKPAQ